MGASTRRLEGEAGLLVHGGAGAVPPDLREPHVAGCREAARAGYAVLAAGGSALDAVQEAARVLERLPQFNAGTGAALNADGEVEHDAAIACGERFRAGAVCALRGYAHPIDVARAVLDDGRHVLVAGEGAARFARERGLASVDPASLVTERARERLAKVLGGTSPAGWAGGTIGAVARDAKGRLAAATSTGGTVGKVPGRVGDSPIVGAGTLAESESAALSATGDGEGILMIGLGHRVAMAIAGGRAAEEVIAQELTRMRERTGATGGLIAALAAGGFVWGRTTATMSWALVSAAGEDAGI
jgi:L-asparaginase / beta-aspartyl-peptidase